MSNENKVVKAYNNLEFLNSPDARVIRILAEYLEPARRFRQLRVQDTIVFFGSARIKSAEEAQKELTKITRKIEEQGQSEELERAFAIAKRDLEMSQFYEDAVQVAKMLTEWSKSLKGSKHRFIICSGGGPGIMEAANKGAAAARGLSIGLNISIPFEQVANPYISRELIFDFHYFFMRKFWFVYLAKALVIFPGGFGTFDELMEVLTLLQTEKLHKPMPVVIYGTRYWKEILNLDAMVRWGTISEKDLSLMHFVDTPQEAFEYLRSQLEMIYLK
ncbi:MAG: LOG family protein [Acidobacteriota bacterium]|nr:LOG family protein [Blastocatellia bacterium]MDW8413360.1 LOG family protein [Acidobacteriota bacterium]